MRSSAPSGRAEGGAIGGAVRRGAQLPGSTLGHRRKLDWTPTTPRAQPRHCVLHHSAADVMTPRVRVASCAAGATAADVIGLSQRTRFLRFPVIGEDADDILGVVHVKQAFALDAATRPRVSHRDLMINPIRVPESMGVDTLLGVLRRGIFQIIVVDEYGGTAGIVTLEDLVEEIVGDCATSMTEPTLVLSATAGVWSSMLAGDLMNCWSGPGCEFPTPPTTRLSVGSSPTSSIDSRSRDEITIAQGRLRVERMDGTRVDRLRYTPKNPSR